MFENLRRGRQARNFTTNVPKILDLKSSSEQIFSENDDFTGRAPTRLHRSLLVMSQVSGRVFGADQGENGLLRRD